MRVVLADLKSNRGFVSKDTVVGGYGSRLDPFSRVTTIMAYLKTAVPRRAERAHGLHRRDPGARRPRREVDARRAGGRRRRARPVVARRSQERNGVGRPDARARRQGRVHRHHGVEDAGAVRRPLRLHPQRRARSGGDAPGAGRRSRRASSSASRSTISIRCRFRAGIWSPRTARKLGIQVVVAAGRRRVSAAREPRLPGVLHLLPAPDPGRLPRAVDRATSSTRSSGCAISIRGRTSSSAIRCSPSSASACLELCDEIQARGLTLTFEAETRLDRLDVDLLDRLHAAGFRAMSFGVESLDRRRR